jgi:hypothetical protein
MSWIFDEAGQIGWKVAFKNNRFRLSFIISIILLIASTQVISFVIKYAEARQGVVLNDPLLSMFSAVDFTWWIFAAIHIFTTLVVISVAKDPMQIFIMITGYSLIVYFRAVSIWLTPLAPPDGIIVLENPIMILLGAGDFHRQDLFYSGHTASMVFCLLAARKKWLRVAMALSGLFVVAAILWQKVHYSIDVYAAPFFAYSAFKIGQWLAKKLFGASSFAS